MSSVTRLLVLVGAAVAVIEELPPSIRALIDEAEDVFVVTPTLTSRLEWLVSDTAGSWTVLRTDSVSR